MAEYIERESMIKHLDILYDRMYAKSPQFYSGFMLARDYVREFPAADVAPVVHGRWKITIEHKDLFDMDVWKYTCSACDEYRLSAIPLSEAIKFCPNCGARMDEEEPE